MPGWKQPRKADCSRAYGRPHAPTLSAEYAAALGPEHGQRCKQAAEAEGEGQRHDRAVIGLSDDAAHGYVPTLIEFVGRRLGLPPEAALTLRDTITPADRERLTGVPGGSVNGPAITSVRSALLRSPTVQPIKGLLHVGASSRPGPGLPFAALSAWNAAEVLRPTRV